VADVGQGPPEVVHRVCLKDTHRDDHLPYFYIRYFMRYSLNFETFAGGF
jgi:hypothetical protein